MIVFNHIPKSAGTSLRIALARAAGVPLEVDGFDHLLFGGFDRFHELAPAIRSKIVDAPGDLPADAALVAGHYGLSTTRARYPLARHMTVLREPRSRVLSHWMFWRGYQRVDLAGWGGWADYVAKAHTSFVDFLEDEAIAAQVDNVALRFLLWPHRSVPVDGFIDEADDDALLFEAMAKIDGMDFVDVIEHAGFERGLAEWLGKPLTIDRHNETAPIPPDMKTSLARELSPRAFMALSRRTRLDNALWLHVARRNLGGAADNIRDASLAQSIARHSLLMGA
jgi:hypothetical protein